MLNVSWNSDKIAIRTQENPINGKLLSGNLIYGATEKSE